MDTKAESQLDIDLRALITLASFYQFTAEELQIQHRLSVHCELLNAEQVLPHLMPILMRFRKHIEALFQPVLTYYISREEQKIESTLIHMPLPVKSSTRSIYIKA